MKRESEVSLKEARQMALGLIDLLRPACERIQIAGSIRRKMPHPNDVEVVAAPKTLEGVNLFDRQCELMLKAGILEKRPDKRGRFAWGEKSKRGIFYHEGQYAAVDLFSVVEPAQWGVIYAIRTGPGKFNRYLVTNQLFRGACPKNRKVAGGRVWDLPYGPEMQEALSALPSSKFLKAIEDAPMVRVVPTPTEQDFFRELKFPWWPPEKRTEERIREWLR